VMPKDCTQLKREFQEFTSDVRQAFAGREWMNSPQAFVDQAMDAELGSMSPDPEDADALALADLRDTRPLLVLVVGTSPQPLLLSVAYFRPLDLILAASNGRAGDDAIMALTGVMQGKGWAPVSASVTHVRFNDGDPADAYVQIVREIRQRRTEGTPVVVDITGGKKTMSAAAFFLTTELEGDVRAVYQDAKHDAEAGRPQPCSTVLRVLHNPAKLLALHTLRNVKHAWDGRRFAVVDELLKSIEDQVGPGVTLSTGGEPSRARAYAQACRHWEEARYRAAVELLGDQGARVDVPPALKEMDELWAGLRPDPGSGLPRTPRTLVCYLVDSWRWMNWRGDIDDRARFQRLFVLGELAIEGLFRHELCRGVVTVGTLRPDDLEGGLDAGFMALMLGSDSGKGNYVRVQKSENKVESFPAKRDSERLREAKRWFSDVGGVNWRRLRNHLSHNAAEVSPGTVPLALQASRELITACAERFHAAGVDCFHGGALRLAFDLDPILPYDHFFPTR